MNANERARKNTTMTSNDKKEASRKLNEKLWTKLDIGKMRWNEDKLVRRRRTKETSRKGKMKIEELQNKKKWKIRTRKEMKIRKQIWKEGHRTNGTRGKTKVTRNEKHEKTKNGENVRMMDWKEAKPLGRRGRGETVVSKLSPTCGQ